ncbi:MAG TPA: hypothetical protein VE621_15645 [Bryobacteraceae bacterium]|nr:hypothetical protein [Bryobacteraceae bacterium]
MKKQLASYILTLGLLIAGSNLLSAQDKMPDDTMSQDQKSDSKMSGHKKKAKKNKQSTSDGADTMSGSNSSPDKMKTKQ